MTVEASSSKCAHPPRSNRPRSSSSGPPGPCMTPSTETYAAVVRLDSTWLRLDRRGHTRSAWPASAQLRCLALQLAECRPSAGPAVLGNGEFDRRVRRLESPDPIHVAACAQDEVIGHVRHLLTESGKRGNRRDGF